MREELGRFRGTRRCVECGGARLNLTARHVHVAGHTLPQVSELSVARALEHHEGLAVSGWRGEIAARIVKEVADRLRFLVDVGLDYLTLDRSAETRPAARHSAPPATRWGGLTACLILDNVDRSARQRTMRACSPRSSACATSAPTVLLLA